jgi:YD repeat-containing protein
MSVPEVLYAPAGYLATASDGAPAPWGFDLSYGYDPQGRLESVTGGSELPYALSLAYTAVGGLESKNDLSYGYGELPHAPTTVGGSSLTYDDNGNRATLSAGDVVTTYTHNAAYQLVKAKASDDDTTWWYTYDGRGNLTHQTPNPTSPAVGEIRYHYDAAGMLVKVERYTASGYETMAEAVYDGDGRRRGLTVWALGMSETLTFTIDAPTGQVLRSESTSYGSTSYLYGLGLIGEQGDAWSYHLPDRNATVRQIVDESGTVTLARLYTPLGALLKERGDGWSVYGFLGAEYDQVSGLIYVGGRYYVFRFATDAAQTR